MASSKGSDPKTSTRYVTPMGKVPLLSALDDEVDWTMVGIEVSAFLIMRWEGYEEALLEPQKVEVNARAEQNKRLNKNNALNTVYSFLVEMCSQNKTAILQVQEHATSGDRYANNLWKMLETRFTQERLNKIQGYLNEIGRVKNLLIVSRN